MEKLFDDKMTEHTPKLDVQTLRYIFSILDEKETDAKRSGYDQHAYGIGVAAFIVKQLIREQQKREE